MWNFSSLAIVVHHINSFERCTLNVSDSRIRQAFFVALECTDHESNIRNWNVYEEDNKPGLPTTGLLKSMLGSCCLVALP